jgi:hypothetical protein
MKPTVCFALLAAMTATAHADNYAPKVGQPHRAFVLPDIETGKPVSLKDYRGKKVLLFHFASW